MKKLKLLLMAFACMIFVNASAQELKSLNLAINSTSYNTAIGLRGGEHQD